MPEVPRCQERSYRRTWRPVEKTRGSLALDDQAAAAL